jgi:hypothetical protein
MAGLRKHKYKIRLKELRQYIERRALELPEGSSARAFAQELLELYDRDESECVAADPREQQRIDRQKFRHVSNVNLCWCADCLWRGKRGMLTFPEKQCPECGSAEIRTGDGPSNEAHR